MIDKNKQKELVEAALDVRKNAFAPFSKFQVAASLLSTDGNITCGINVESSSYGLTVCAERNAISAAIANGKKEFVALAVISRGAAYPCGACRQVIFDICGNIDIIVADENGEIKDITDTKTLLPKAFGIENLE
ncbi:MAG: cytidine deaminase [Candidatus Neomarinimicrobiota bacterium]